MNIDLLKSAMEDAFSEMTGSGSDSSFASGVSNGCSDVVDTVLVAGPVSGSDTSPSGSFTGTGTGTMSVDSSICYGIIYSTAIAMNGNDGALASAIANGIDKMCTEAVFTLTIDGATSGSSGGPSSDAGEGTFTGDPSIIENALNSVFGRMTTTGSDDDLIGSLCSAFQEYLENAQVQMVGKTHLAGSSGIGTIS